MTDLFDDYDFLEDEEDDEEFYLPMPFQNEWGDAVHIDDMSDISAKDWIAMNQLNN